MGFYRLYPEKDTWITNAHPDNDLTVRATGSNHGKSPALNVFARKADINSSSIELARTLIQFSMTELSGLVFDEGKIPLSGVDYYLKMYNQPTPDTLPSSYTVEVYPVRTSWDEGNGIDDDNHLDLGFASWKDATSTKAWAVTGSDYLSETNFVLSLNDGRDQLISLSPHRSGSKIYACGDSEDNTATIWESQDRGASWTVVFSSGSGHPNANGIDVGKNGDIYMAIQALSPVRPIVAKLNASSSDTYQIVDTEGTGSPYAMAVDQSDSSRAYYTLLNFGTSTAYVRRTDDYGATWSNVFSSGTAGFNFPDIEVAENGDVYFVAATVMSGGYVHNVYKSTDGGDNWTALDPFLVPGGAGGWTFGTSIHIKNNGEIYAGLTAATGSLYKAIVRKSANSGSTWSTIYESDAGSSFLIKPTSITTVRDDVYISLILSSSEGLKSTVLKSEDDGGTWHTLREYRRPGYNTYGEDIVSFNGDIFYSETYVSPDFATLSGSVHYLGSYGSASQHFDRGDEDLEVNVTSIVNEWLSASRDAGGTPNYGLVVKLSGTEEDNGTNYYRKSFHARETLYIDKMPYLEARWNDVVKDNRYNFGYDISNTLAFYNNVRGDLTTLNGPITVQIKDSLIPGSASYSASFSAAEISTGIFTASIYLSSTGSYSGSVFYDIWDDNGSVKITGSFTPKFLTGSDVDINQEYTVNVNNLKRTYTTDELARLVVNVRKKDFVTHVGVISTGSLEMEKECVEKMYFSVINDETGETVIPFGTGSVPYTQLSYNKSGNYFDLWMRSFVPGFKYRLLFLLDINNDKQVVDDGFVFKVK